MLRTIRRFLLLESLLKLLAFAASHAAPSLPEAPATIEVRPGSSIIQSLRRAGIRRPSASLLDGIRRLNHLKSLDRGVAPGKLLLPGSPTTPGQSPSLPLPGTGVTLALAFAPTALGHYFRRRKAAKDAVAALKAAADTAQAVATAATSRAERVTRLASTQAELLELQRQTIERLTNQPRSQINRPRLTRRRAFERLGLPESASITDVKRRRRELARYYHPDSGCPSPEPLQAINEAVDVLLAA